MWTRVLKLDAVDNFRDFGGWRATGGTRVSRGRLFRSAHHAQATAADLERIGALSIATVTDLRHPSEQRKEPSAWIGTLPFDLIEEAGEAGRHEVEAPHMMALRDSDFSHDAMRAFLTAHYGEMPYDPRHIALFRRYFEALASRDGAMLIHCAAGKDRTGILAGLTHHVLAVHPDDAMEDYLLSNDAFDFSERLPQVRQSMTRIYGRDISDKALRALLGVIPDYIANCWAAITARSGSIDAYLNDMLGVDETKRLRIRERLYQ